MFCMRKTVQLVNICVCDELPKMQSKEKMFRKVQQKEALLWRKIQTAAHLR